MNLGGRHMKYDMDVDYDTLRYIKEKLEKIKYDLDNSSVQMLGSIQNSEGFLSGVQFEKAKKTTINCIQIIKKTSDNIRHSNEYITTIMSLLEEYEQYGYK